MPMRPTRARDGLPAVILGVIAGTVALCGLIVAIVLMGDALASFFCP